VLAVLGLLLLMIDVWYHAMIYNMVVMLYLAGLSNENPRTQVRIGAVEIVSHMK